MKSKNLPAGFIYMITPARRFILLGTSIKRELFCIFVYESLIE